MSATPQVGQKRSHLEFENLRNPEDLMALLAINRSIGDLKYSINSNPNFEISEEVGSKNFMNTP